MKGEQAFQHLQKDPKYPNAPPPLIIKLFYDNGSVAAPRKDRKIPVTIKFNTPSDAPDTITLQASGRTTILKLLSALAEAKGYTINFNKSVVMSSIKGKSYPLNKDSDIDGDKRAGYWPTTNELSAQLVHIKSEAQREIAINYFLPNGAERLLQLNVAETATMLDILKLVYDDIKRYESNAMNGYEVDFDESFISTDSTLFALDNVLSECKKWPRNDTVTAHLEYFAPLGVKAPAMSTKNPLDMKAPAPDRSDKGVSDDGYEYESEQAIDQDELFRRLPSILCQGGFVFRLMGDETRTPYIVPINDTDGTISDSLKNNTPAVPANAVTLDTKVAADVSVVQFLEYVRSKSQIIWDDDPEIIDPADLSMYLGKVLLRNYDLLTSLTDNGGGLFVKRITITASLIFTRKC